MALPTTSMMPGMAVGMAPTGHLTQPDINARNQAVQELEAARHLLPDDTWTYIRKDALERQDPSLRDGLDPAKLKLWRRQVLKVITAAGIQLKVPQWCIATAALLCHRFFSRRSMKRNDRYVIAMACLLLACKMEESPKPVRELIRECRKVMGHGTLDPNNPKDAADLDATREEVLTAERAVLYTLGFNLTIVHPYRFLVNFSGHVLNEFCQHMSELGLLHQNARGENQFKHLMQNTWNFVNDSFRTTLCLQYSPVKIAGAALYLANELNMQIHGPTGDIMQYVRYVRPGEPNITFFEHFQIHPVEIQDITTQMLEVYEDLKGANRLMKPPPATTVALGPQSPSPYNPTPPKPSPGMSPMVMG